MTLRIADSRVDLDTGEVWTDGESRRLTPKSASVLRYLCTRPQELATSEELLEAFWGSFAADNAVQKAISEIRAAFGDDAKNPRVVRTVSKRGYILIATPREEKASPAESGAPETPRIAPEPSGAGSLSGRTPSRWLGPLLVVLVGAGLVVLFQSRLDAPGGEKVGDASPPRPPLTSIAVLPFDDLSPEGDQAWLTDGLSEQLIESLARVEALQVMARTSAEAASRKGLDALGIGEQLGVGSFVEGSVRTSGDQIRITAQLIRTDDGSHLWSATYDRARDDVLALQTEIGQEIAEAIREELGATGPSWLQRSRYRATDVRAWELVRRGVELEDLGTEEGLRGEIALTEEALAIDPDYAQAHAQQGFAHWFLYQFGFDRTDAQRARAAEKARDALALEPDNPSANNLLVELAMQSGRWAEAEERVRQAVAVTPRIGPLRSSYAAILANRGRFDEAVEQARRAQRLDPLDPGFRATLGIVLTARGDNDEAIEELERARSTGRRDVVPWLLVAYSAAGREAEGIALLEEMVGDKKRVEEVYASDGYTGAVRLWLEVPRPSVCRQIPLLALARMDAQVRSCFESLTELGLGAWYFLSQHPVYAPYRNEPWFEAIVGRYGLEAAASRRPPA